MIKRQAVKLENFPSPLFLACFLSKKPKLELKFNRVQGITDEKFKSKIWKHWENFSKDNESTIENIEKYFNLEISILSEFKELKTSNKVKIQQKLCDIPLFRHFTLDKLSLKLDFYQLLNEMARIAKSIPIPYYCTLEYSVFQYPT